MHMSSIASLITKSEPQHVVLEGSYLGRINKDISCTASVGSGSFCVPAQGLQPATFWLELFYMEGILSSEDGYEFGGDH